MGWAAGELGRLDGAAVQMVGCAAGAGVGLLLMLLAGGVDWAGCRPLAATCAASPRSEASLGPEKAAQGKPGSRLGRTAGQEGAAR